MGISTGEQYIRRINQLKTNILLDGSGITGDISDHPAFKGVMASQAKLYDLQHQPELKEIMTYVSDTSGNRIGTSFLEPKTKEGLEKRRLMIQEWAKSHAGMMGRSPDYMNTILMVLNAAAELFTAEDEKCAENIRHYYDYVRENDLSLTHVFVSPQKDRSSKGGGDTAARMIKKTADGIVVNGSRILATQAGITDEILVYPVPSNIDDEAFSYAFAIPCDTPGLTFICRESFTYKESHYDHPLGSRYDEMDAIVLFDNVLVPWDRVFLHGSSIVKNLLYSQSRIFEHTAHQVVSKNVIKTEFILGTIQLIIDGINIGEYQHIREKFSEVAIALEVMKGLLHQSEKNAKVNQWGTLTPEPNPLLAAVNYYPRIYPRFMEIIQLISASGLVAIPSEKDFGGDQKEVLNHHLQSANQEGYERVKLFRLAWDLSMSAFGSRQKLYERFFFGDPVRLADQLYGRYDRGDSIEMVKDFLAGK
ncbi:4-hydroxyphenylacetate 3-monooxygenase, oxygenase component [Jeotgalibacillus haloalkalitolerans]|uniref:4-hydroxyphenylacetate 3-monooxygenase, oxygenase component n=1 Tax=Jeotgalibacillus haloalkalitolerans TaxID=3104292 RepID=A0ABU5KHM8_9BACL|nr:4-hydroxyphenylacetate 3-monooxygenase, oxygenase component [Jeotgalibacillus sp. HH7-29]MDZ5710669.1 4-hydroxyphenylacetate 3-monooxygenase, oxygenase component [Jeotgalibacillus sp. HH7-29]